LSIVEEGDRQIKNTTFYITPPRKTSLDPGTWLSCCNRDFSPLSLPATITGLSPIAYIIHICTDAAMPMGFTIPYFGLALRLLLLSSLVSFSPLERLMKWKGCLRNTEAILKRMGTQEMERQQQIFTSSYTTERRHRCL
jgi:hypothetical protein